LRVCRHLSLLSSEQDFNSACSKSVFAEEPSPVIFMIVTHASDVARLNG
jgi:hypothetical protein